MIVCRQIYQMKCFLKDDYNRTASVNQYIIINITFFRRMNVLRTEKRTNQQVTTAQVYSRVPKIALPTRTIVLPSSIAI